MAKADLLNGLKTNYYSKVELQSEGTVMHGEGRKTLWAQYHLDRAEKSGDPGLRVFSEIHVSGARSHIIKIRVSGTLDDEARFQPAIKSFTKELLKRLND